MGGGGAERATGAHLHPPEAPRERKLTADQVVSSLRVKMAKIPGIRVFIINPPAINIGGRFASGLYQFTLQSSDLESLYKAAPRARSQAARRTPCSRT